MNILEKSKIYFSLLKDVRDKSYITYELEEILFIVMCGMICGCKDIEEMVEVLENKIEVIQKYIEIERIPCESTFTIILSAINPDEMDLCMVGILKNVIG